MAELSRTIRVFVSSTFRDMQAERDELIKYTFPKLRKLCDERNVVWSEVDLRWGITEEQSERGEVLPICLAEIQRCRPYFIGLLGERYGWIPDEIPQELIDQEGWLKEHLNHSVTELEILHGILNDPQMNDHALFYFRDSAYLNSLPDKEKTDFIEIASDEEIEKFGQSEAENRAEERRQKLVSLKARIKEHCEKNKMPEPRTFPNPKELGEMILRDMTEIIERLYPKDEISEPLDRDALEHEAFAQSRAKIYIKRQDYFDRLNEHAQWEDQPLVVLGESGSGKSALLSNWALQYRQTHPEDLLIMQFIGATPYSADWAAMLRRIMGELKRRFDIQQDIPDKPDELKPAFTNFLHMAAAKGRCVLILDALNQLEDHDGALDLVWLPPFIPPNVRMILSTLPGRPLDNLKERGLTTLQIEPLDFDERKKLIKDYLAQFSKELNDTRTELITNAKQTANPLFLRALLDELRVFGIYEKLDERIEHYLKAQTVDKLYEKILTRYEQDYERERPALVKDAMSLIWASRRGLSEAELLDLLGTNDEPMPRAFWSPLYLAAESSLVIRSGLISFGNEYVRQAVSEQYIFSENILNSIHGKLADYFEQNGLSLRKLDEQLFHESKSLRWIDLKKSLTNIPILEFASSAHKETWHKERKYEWVSYWNLLSFQWQPNICYEEVIRELIKTDGETLRIASISTIVGNLLIEMGQYQEAETFVKKAVEVEYFLFGPSPKLVPAFNNLAMLYKLQGKYRNSLSYFEESLRFLDLEGNSEKSVLATVLNNLAQLYIELGYFDKALVFHNRALNIRRELFHLRHPEIGISLDNIGKTLQVLGRFEEALTYHEEALAILKETTGEKSIDVAKCLTNMGHANHLLGDSENAVVFYNRALGIINETLGSGHLSTAILLNNLGGVSHELKNYQEAMTLFKQAIQIIEKRLGANHPAISMYLDNLAAVQIEIGDFDEAFRLENRALELAKTNLGFDHPDTIKYMSNLKLLKSFNVE